MNVGQNNGHDNDEDVVPTLEERNEYLEGRVASLESEVRRQMNLVKEMKNGMAPIGRVIEIFPSEHVEMPWTATIKFVNDAGFKLQIEPGLESKVKVGSRVVCAPNRTLIVEVLPDEPSTDDLKLKLVEYPKFGYNEIIGVEEQLKSLRGSVEFILDKNLQARRDALVNDPSILDDVGSVLLFGPPGVGKTYISKAVAGSLSARDQTVAFIKVEAQELITRWLGESSENIRKVFSLARKEAPSILFMDEVDSLVATRFEAQSGADQERNGVVGQLLTEMGEGFRSNKGVAVILATNFPQILDRAFLDRVKNVIYIPPPRTEAEVGAVFAFYLAKIKTDFLLAENFAKIWAIVKTRKQVYEVSLPSRGIAIREIYTVTPRDVKNLVHEVVSEAAFEGDQVVTLDRLLAHVRKMVSKEQGSRIVS